MYICLSICLSTSVCLCDHPTCHKKSGFTTTESDCSASRISSLGLIDLWLQPLL